MNDKSKRAAVDVALTHMFGTLEARGVPEHLRAVVDQLDAAAQAESAAEADETVRLTPPPPSSPEP